MVLHDIPDYKSYIKEWRKGNSDAEEVPLTEGGLLNPVRSSHFDYDRTLGITLADAKKHAASAPKFECVNTRRTNLVALEQTDSFSLILLKPLSVGSGKWAQVWLARLQCRPAKVEAPTVVVKLFQESLYPALEWIDFRNDSYWTATELSHRESWAYAMLQDLQGLIIAHSYGFFDFHLPCGQLVCGHVIEFVEGHSLSRNWSSIKDGTWYSPEATQVRCSQLDRFMHCIHQIHLRGVIHNDLRPKNVIVPTSDPNSFVFIDFGIAQSLFHLDSEIHGKASNDDLGVVKCFQEIEECLPGMIWLARRREAAPWAAIFSDFKGFEEWLHTSDAVEQLKRVEFGIQDRLLW